MADGQFPTLVSKDQSVNAATNPLFTALTDGTTAATFTGSSLNVNVTGGAANTQYAEDAAHVSGDIGTQILAVRRDTLATSVSADGDYSSLSVNNVGALYVHVNNTVTVTGTVAVSSVAGNVTVVQPTGTNLHVVVDSGAITVSATDLDIRDLTLAQDAVKVSANSTANSATNPIFVQIAEATLSTEVNSYNTAAAVAGGASSNHDYTVTGTTFLLKSILAACSGAEKIEVQVGPVASLVSKAVAFIPNTGGFVNIVFNPPIEVPATSTGTVRVIRTNRNLLATDVYSTILGNDLP